MATETHPPTVQPHALLRRLMVLCPHTGLPVDTGYELTAIPAISRDWQTLIDCMECGEDHLWRMEQAFLA